MRWATSCSRRSRCCPRRRATSSASATGESAAARSSSRPRDTFLEPAIWPFPNSPDSRTSRTSAPSPTSALRVVREAARAPFDAPRRSSSFRPSRHRRNRYQLLARRSTGVCSMRMRASTATQPSGPRAPGSGRARRPRAAPRRDGSAAGRGRQRVRVGRRRAAETGDEPPGLARRDELLRVGVGQRRDPEAGAADQLGLDAAWAERDQRAEDRILHDAREQLDAAAPSAAR